MFDKYVIYLSLRTEAEDPCLKITFLSDLPFPSRFYSFIYQSCMIIDDEFWVDDGYDDEEFIAYLFLSTLKCVPLVSFLEFMNSCSCIYYKKSYGLSAVSKLYSDLCSEFEDLPF